MSCKGKIGRLASESVVKLCILSLDASKQAWVGGWLGSLGGHLGMQEARKLDVPPAWDSMRLLTNSHNLT